MSDNLPSYSPSFPKCKSTLSCECSRIMHITWRAVALLVILALHACVATSLRLEFSSTDPPPRIDVVRFADATNATHNEVEELVRSLLQSK